MTDTVTLSLDDATSLIQNAFVALGVDQTASLSVARALVEAEADGQVGHGFSRLSDYMAQVKSGKINNAANITTKAVYPAALLTDADCGFAYAAIDQAIEQGITAAHTYGIAAMAIGNSHHCGSLSIHVEKIAKAGLIGFMVTNAPSAIAPWGGTKPLFGTNPIAFAVPRQGQNPLVIDMSLSVVARGKIMHAAKTGQPIPEGWALDLDGNATTNPQDALKGTMVPVGGPKGTALALMVEILSASMTGANFSFEASSFFTPEGPSPRIGHYIIAMKPAEAETNFAHRLEVLLSEIVSQDGARLPGMRRFEKRADAEQHGITIPKSYVDLAQSIVTAP